MVWAEYGGTIEAGNLGAWPRYVVLTDKAEQSIRVPYSGLSPQDRSFADQGREWAHVKPGRYFLVDDNRQSIIIKRTVGVGSTQSISYSPSVNDLPTSDREWLERFRAAKKRSLDLDDVVAEWFDFVDYKLPGAK